jgi:hypothetical protein
LLVAEDPCSSSAEGGEAIGIAGERLGDDDDPRLEGEISLGCEGGRFQLSDIRRFGGVDDNETEGIVDGVDSAFERDDERIEVGGAEGIFLPVPTLREGSQGALLLFCCKAVVILYKLSVELDFEVACWL